ncbi:MAG: alpha/beta fold hydrolase [Spongiibacteraceae bacterium]
MPEKYADSPGLHLGLSELHRSAVELAHVVASWRCLHKVPQGNGHPVIVIPPFTTADWSTTVLRKYLKKIGYQSYRWKQGVNVNALKLYGFDDAMTDISKSLDGLMSRLDDIHQRHDSKVTLIGWSLGGVLARKLASHHPEKVQRVITLGSPMGNLRELSLVKTLQRIRKVDVTYEEMLAWLDFIDIDHGDVPVDVLYSHGDGIVPASMATSRGQGQVENFRVGASHIGFGANPEVFRLLAHRLSVDGAGF